MTIACWSCHTATTDYPPGTTVGRQDCCLKCGADIHCCYQCRHFDKSAYNSCKEPQAERVLDKDRGNFCDYFSLGEGSGAQGTEKEDPKKKLEDLFK